MSTRRKPMGDLTALRTFTTVAATGSMTVAARRLGITQSAVSQSVRQLEEVAGLVLVERGSRPLRLTVAGRALQRYAAPLLDDADALLALVREAAADKVAELRIGIIDSFATSVGPSLIRPLLEVASSVSLRSGLARDQSEGLLSRQLDFIVTSEPLDDLDGLERHLIATEPFVLLLPSAPRAAARAAVPDDLRPEDLRALATRSSLIRFSARSQIGAQIDRHLRRLGVRAPRFVEVDATDTLAAMVAGGLGWAMTTPLCLLQVRSRLDQLRVEPLPPPGFNRQLWLICRAGEYAKLAARIAVQSRRILERECLPPLRRALPWLAEPMMLARSTACSTTG